MSKVHGFRINLEFDFWEAVERKLEKLARLEAGEGALDKTVKDAKRQ